MKTNYICLKTHNSYLFVEPQKIDSIKSSSHHCSIVSIGFLQYEVFGDPKDIIATIEGQKYREYSDLNEMKEDADILGETWVRDHDNNNFFYEDAYDFGPEALAKDFVWAECGLPCAIDVESRVLCSH